MSRTNFVEAEMQKMDENVGVSVTNFNYLAFVLVFLSVS
jgi:hypothetical protein